MPQLDIKYLIYGVIEFNLEDHIPFIQYKILNAMKND